MFKENLPLSKMERTKLEEPALFGVVGDFQICSYDLFVGYSLVLNHIRLELRNVGWSFAFPMINFFIV